MPTMMKLHKQIPHLPIENERPILTKGSKLLENPNIPYSLLLNPSGFSCVRVNSSAGEAIKLCNGRLTVKEICKNLSSKYGVKFDVILEDLKKIFTELYSYGLINFIGWDSLKSTEYYDPSQGPAEIWFHITNKCNLRCITCFKNAGESLSYEMKYEEIKKLIMDIECLVRKTSNLKLIISGGEPLLRKDLNKILRFIKQRNFHVHLITNGTLITREIAEEWKEIGVDFIQVSLDGSKPEVNDAIRGEGSFKRAIKGASILRELGIRFSLYPTVTRYNIDDLPNMMDKFTKFAGRDNFNCAFFGPVGRGQKNKHILSLEASDYINIFKILLKNVKLSTKMNVLRGFNAKLDRVPANLTRKLNCGLASATLSIDADGSVYPCQWLHLPEYRAGNVLEQHISEIYYTSNVLRKLRSIRVDMLEDCFKCTYRYICGGGCRAQALFSCGRIDAKDPLCDFYRFFLEHALWGFWEG